MADYRLSDQAARKLINIYDFTETTFGRYQADAYQSGLERTSDCLPTFRKWVAMQRS